jgi:lipopolysaccharide transport system permease protein
MGRDIWEFRELLFQLTLRDVRIRYKQAVMGFGWAIFMPILIVLSGLLVRLAMAQMSGRPLAAESIASMAVKALPWAFFVGSVGFATSSLVTNANLVTKIAFPRAVLPLSSTLAQTFDSGIGAAVMVLVLPWLGVRPSWGLVWVPVLAFLLFLTTLSAGLLLSALNLFFRDVKYIVQVLLTFGIFFTPVLYEPVALGSRVSRLLMLNPLSPLLEGMRLAVLEGHNLLRPLAGVTAAGVPVVVWNPLSRAYGGAWAIGGTIISLMIFHRLEGLFAEKV